MASSKGKSKYMENVAITEGAKWTHSSKKHYRPHHSKINKKMEHFDNDIMWVVLETKLETIEMEFGINHKRWSYSDYELNDDMKDGNGRY